MIKCSTSFCIHESWFIWHQNNIICSRNVSKVNIWHEQVIHSLQNASEMTGAIKQDNLHLKTHHPLPNPTVTNPNHHYSSSFGNLVLGPRSLKDYFLAVKAARTRVGPLSALKAQFRETIGSCQVEILWEMSCWPYVYKNIYFEHILGPRDERFCLIMKMENIKKITSEIFSCDIWERLKWNGPFLKKTRKIVVTFILRSCT